jgi:hypothetical protein
MWRVVTPLLGQGAFANLRLRPQQIVSQLLDTLNRAALNALTLEEAIARQSRTWAGDPERRFHLDDAATAARAFRRRCLGNSLLDLSLMVEVFDTQLVRHPEFHRYFRERYRHLLVDNLEEQTPAGQNFVVGLMGETQTTAVAGDAGGGYKRFLAADPHGAEALRGRFDRVYDFTRSFVAPPELERLANQVDNALLHTHLPTEGAEARLLGVVGGRYRREMVNNLAPVLHNLVYEGGVAPRDIAIVVPYMDGALRYMLTQALATAGLPYRLLRRRTSPREEPRVRAWLTWLALAHPDWGIQPAPYDVAEALTLSIAGLDPARAQLLTDNLYRPDGPELAPADGLPARIVERVGAEHVALAEELRLWLAGRDPLESIDAFLHSLFNELLAQPRFRPEPDMAGAAVAEWLAGAAARLRRAAPAMGLTTPAETGAAFIDAVNQGLVTANPPDWGEPPDPEGIVLSTLYAYLLAGRAGPSPGVAGDGRPGVVGHSPPAAQQRLRPGAKPRPGGAVDDRRRLRRAQRTAGAHRPRPRRALPRRRHPGQQRPRPARPAAGWGVVAGVGAAAAGGRGPSRVRYNAVQENCYGRIDRRSQALHCH